MTISNRYKKFFPLPQNPLIKWNLDSLPALHTALRKHHEAGNLYRGWWPWTGVFRQLPRKLGENCGPPAAHYNIFPPAARLFLYSLTCRNVSLASIEPRPLHIMIRNNSVVARQNSVLIFPCEVSALEPE